MCRELYDHRDWLWTFVRVEGVEPTNNASERALRHAIIQASRSGAVATNAFWASPTGITSIPGSHSLSAVRSFTTRCCQTFADFLTPAVLIGQVARSVALNPTAICRAIRIGGGLTLAKTGVAAVVTRCSMNAEPASFPSGDFRLPVISIPCASIFHPMK